MNKTQLSQRVHELDGSSGIVRVNCSVSRPAAGPEGCIAKPYAVWCSSFLRIRNRLINAQVANSRLALPNFSFITANTCSTFDRTRAALSQPTIQPTE